MFVEGVVVVEICCVVLEGFVDVVVDDGGVDGGVVGGYFFGVGDYVGYVVVFVVGEYVVDVFEGVDYFVVDK